MTAGSGNRIFPVTIAIAVALASLGAAPPASAPVQDWSNAEVVVVTPDKPSPALWHIIKDKSEVWILPTVSPVPKDLQWDSDEVVALLKGANLLLLPPRATVGVFEGLWFYTWHMDTLEQPDGTRLEATLPEPLKGRFIWMRTHIGQDEDRYGKYLGGVAALRLENDYWDYAHMTAEGPMKTVETLAARAGVPARTTATYPAMDVVHDIPKMSAAAHRACIEYALQDIETAAAHADLAAKAWAKGDLEGVKANYLETKLDACLQQSSAYSALRETANRDMTNAILVALKKPGRVVVVMPMGFFLRKGGVLDRLQAAGVTVSGPGG